MGSEETLPEETVTVSYQMLGLTLAHDHRRHDWRTYTMSDLQDVLSSLSTQPPRKPTLAFLFIFYRA